MMVFGTAAVDGDGDPCAWQWQEEPRPTTFRVKDRPKRGRNDLQVSFVDVRRSLTSHLFLVLFLYVSCSFAWDRMRSHEITWDHMRSHEIAWNCMKSLSTIVVASTIRKARSMLGAMMDNEIEVILYFLDFFDMSPHFLTFQPMWFSLMQLHPMRLFPHYFSVTTQLCSRPIDLSLSKK